MGRLSGFQQSLIAVCALGLAAGSTLARIPHQDKPTQTPANESAEKPAAGTKPTAAGTAQPPAATKSGTPPTTDKASTPSMPTKPMPAQPPVATPPPVAPAAPVTVVVQQPATPQQDASSGWIGILIAVALGYAGFRFAQNKGFTVVGMLTKAGVTLPKDPDPVPQAQRPGNTATTLPPLPGLDALPSPTPGTAAQPPSLGICESGPLVLIAADGQAAGKRFKLSGTMTVGRDASCDIALTNDQTISRSHAELHANPDGRFSVTDKGSSNGTFLNGSQVTGTVDVTSGDTLVFGAQRFRVEVDA